MFKEIPDDISVNNFFDLITKTEKYLSKDPYEFVRFTSTYDKTVRNTQFGVSPVSSITPSGICKVLKSIELKSCTLRMRTAINDIISFGRDCGLLNGDPMKPIHIHEEDNGTLNCQRVLTDEELPIFLFFIENEPMRNCYYLSLLEGLRLGECLGLRWEDVDFERRILSIRVHQKVVSNPKNIEYVLVEATKNGKQRRIAMAPIVYDLLMDELKRKDRKIDGSLGRYQNPTGLVFTDEYGNPYHPQRLQGTVYRISKAMGIDDFSFHGLRRTFATQCIRSGADISTVQQMLDHYRATLTLRHYIGCTTEMKKDAAQKLEKKICKYLSAETLNVN